MNNSEPNLIARMQKDDHQAFQHLYYKHYDKILAYICSFIHCRHEAKDILQEVFVSLWENRCRLHNVTSVEAYLRVTARNRVLNLIRHQGLKPIHEEYAASADAHEVSQIDFSQLEYTDFENLMNRLINDLPTSQRRVVTMSRFEEKSHKEICQLLNLRIQTVKNALSTALRTLHKRLKDINQEDIYGIKRGGVKVIESICYVYAL